MLLFWHSSVAEKVTVCAAGGAATVAEVIDAEIIVCRSGTAVVGSKYQLTSQ